MRFNLLYNFISPVTGRVLADPDYVLVGNARGVAVPSPILIDTRLELVNLRNQIDELLTSTFILNFPNIQLPNAQVLSSLPDGFMSNVGGLITTSDILPVEGLPDLTHTYLWTGDSSDRPVEVQTIILNNMPNLSNNNIWRGNGSNRPIESNALTTAEGNIGSLQNNVSSLLTNLGNLANTVNAISNTVDALSSSVDAIETGLGVVGGLFGFVGIAATIIGMGGAISANASHIDALEDVLTSITDDISRIDNDIHGIHLSITAITGRIDGILLNTLFANAPVSFWTQRLTNLGDPINPTDGVNLRTLNSVVGAAEVTLDGEVTGTGTIGGTITTELQLTLDEIKVAENTVNLNDQKIVNLKTDEVEEQDALNFKFFWDFMHNRVEVSWPS